MTKQTAQKPDLFASVNGKVVTMTIEHDDVRTIEKYKHSATARTLRQFAKDTVKSTIRWMERMINGQALFELESMDYWRYDRNKNKLYLTIDKELVTQSTVFDMDFTKGTLQEYNQGMATILSSFWYKTYAAPHVVVELIACCDLLYREHHNNMSPAGTARIPYGTQAA